CDPLGAFAKPVWQPASHNGIGLAESGVGDPPGGYFGRHDAASPSLRLAGRGPGILLDPPEQIAASGPGCSARPDKKPPPASDAPSLQRSHRNVEDVSRLRFR